MIGGNFVEGGRLTAHPGTWSPEAGMFRALRYDYQWERCDSPQPQDCSPATATAAYQLTPLDGNKWFRLVTTATNAVGSGSATSGFFGPVSVTAGPLLPPRNVSPPVISGNPRVGQLLDASEGVWYAAADTTFAYQWQRCTGGTCADIPGAVAPYYVGTDADVGAQLQVRVTPQGASVATPGLVSVVSESTERMAVCDSPEGSSCSPSPCEPPYYKPGVAKIQLLPPTTVRPNGADLVWIGSAGQYFRSFEVHRSTIENFEPTPATRLATFTDPAASSYSDTTGVEETYYYYKVVLVTTCETLVSRDQKADLPLADTVTRNVQVSKSTFIFLTSDTTTSSCANAGADPSLTVGATGSQLSRALLSFDLSFIPSDARIIGAQLSLWNRGQTGAELSIALHRVAQTWTEGTGRSSPPTCTRDGASWSEASGGVAWATQGGRFDTPTSATLLADQPAPHWDRFGVAALVEGWWGDGLGAFGVLLKAPQDDETARAGAVAYASDDDPDRSVLPVLSVTYTTLPEAVPPDASQPAYVEELDESTPTDPWTDPNASEPPLNDPGDGSSGYVPKGGVVIQPVRYKKNQYGVGFWNDDGYWRFWYDTSVCTGQLAAASSTVGPGYLNLFRDAHFLPNGQRSAALTFVNGYQKKGHFAEAGGIGLFGMHFLRGQSQGGQFDLTAAGNAKVVEGQYCEGSVHPQSGGIIIGVSKVQVAGCSGAPQSCKFHVGDYGKLSAVGKLDVNVFFREDAAARGTTSAPDGESLIEVRYRWRIYPEIVKVWMSVVTYARSNASGTPFLKEPKFVATLLSGTAKNWTASEAGTCAPARGTPTASTPSTATPSCGLPPAGTST